MSTLDNKVNAFITIAKIKRQLMDNKLIAIAKEACRKEGKDYNAADPYNEEEWYN